MLFVPLLRLSFLVYFLVKSVILQYKQQGAVKMKIYEVTYRPYNHYDWVCLTYVQAKDGCHALLKAKKEIQTIHGKTGYEIVSYKEIG